MTKKHGVFEIACNAEIMDQALIITKSKWDKNEDQWNGHLYDFKNHNCQDYIDVTLKVYLGLGGILFFKSYPSYTQIND